MKFQKTAILSIFLFSVFLSNSQEIENSISELMFTEWIKSTVDFLKQNNDVSDAKLMSRLSSLMINSFYPYPIEKDKFDSFKGTIISFLKNKYPLEFGREKLYFFQKLSPHGHISSSDYLILDNKNRLKVLSGKYDSKHKWHVKKTSRFDFGEFENKFNSLNAFHQCENKNEGGFFYYLITEFDGRKINIKFVDASCNLKF